MWNQDELQNENPGKKTHEFSANKRRKKKSEWHELDQIAVRCIVCAQKWRERIIDQPV